MDSSRFAVPRGDRSRSGTPRLARVVSLTSLVVTLLAGVSAARPGVVARPRLRSSVAETGLGPDAKAEQPMRAVLSNDRDPKLPTPRPRPPVTAPPDARLSVTSVEPAGDTLAGGARVVVEGTKFSVDSRVVLGDAVVADLTVESDTRLTFTVPPQRAPGTRTLTIRTADAVAQVPFRVAAEPFSDLTRGDVTTVVGGVEYVGDGGPAVGPNVAVAGAWTATDSVGNLYIADRAHRRVRRVDAETGTITTVAGTGLVSGDGARPEDGRLALTAPLQPAGIAVSASDDIFVSDAGTGRIWRVDHVSGAIGAYAGGGTEPDTQGGSAANASIVPGPLAFDAAGDLFVVQSGTVVSRIDAATGRISRYAGNGESAAAVDGARATESPFAQIVALALDGEGDLYLSEQSANRVRKVSASTGTVSTVAGNGAVARGVNDVLATESPVAIPVGIALDASGDLFVTEYADNRVRRVDAQTGVITSVLNRDGGFPKDGPDGGLAVDAGVFSPTSLCADRSGNLFVGTEPGTTDRVWRIDAATGILSVYAGSGELSNLGDAGPGALAGIGNPWGLASDRRGGILIADASNSRIRRYDAATGTVTTIAGGGPVDASTVFNYDPKPATGARLFNPRYVATDGRGDVYIADSFLNAIFRVDAATGVMTRLVGGRTRFGYEGDGGPAVDAAVRRPTGIACDDEGNVYFADQDGTRVRRIDPNGIITTYAGNGEVGYGGNGGPATEAALGLANVQLGVDRDGNLLIPEYLNNRLRRVDRATGVITLVAGNGRSEQADTGVSGTGGDGGPALDATLSIPSGVTADSANNLYVASGNVVRRIDAKTGVITTVLGRPAGVDYRGDGWPATAARYSYTYGGVALDEAGNLYFADVLNLAVRAVRLESNALFVSAVSYDRKRLTITGGSLGSDDARVLVNGADVSARVTERSDTALTLVGGKKRLGLRAGANTVRVESGGATSNAFVVVR